MGHLLRNAAAMLVAVLLAGCQHLESGSTASLTDTLTKQLGVTQTQAAGGVGSMMEMSKAKLSPAQFEQVSKSMPGVDTYLKAAEGMGLNVSDMAGVKSAFSKLGMSPEMVDKFKPVVLDYAGQYGGDTTKSLLAAVLK
jgi:hypothetical protein